VAILGATRVAQELCKTAGSVFALSLPDPLLRYVLEAKPIHEVLRRALIQLSGFLLKRLTAAGGKLVDFEPVDAARAGIGEASDELRSLRVPPTAAHHRLHLDGAASTLELALAIALSSTNPDQDALYYRLEEAGKHLRAASRALPGFEAVDFTQSCCAAHSRSATLAAPPFDS
jgi:hypothetical protein